MLNVLSTVVPEPGYAPALGGDASSVSFGASFSPDSNSVAYVTFSDLPGIYVLPLLKNGSAPPVAPTRVGSAGGGNWWMCAQPPAWSSDGTRLACSTKSSAGSSDSIQLVVFTLP